MGGWTVDRREWRVRVRGQPQAARPPKPSWARWTRWSTGRRRGRCRRQPPIERDDDRVGFLAGSRPVADDHLARDPRDPVKKLLGCHAYRRKWATERKHLPLKDVAEADGRLDTPASTAATSRPTRQRSCRSSPSPGSYGRLYQKPYQRPPESSEAPQRRSLQGLTLLKSGRRDLNPRPPEPHALEHGGEVRQSLVIPRCSGRACRTSGGEKSGVGG